MKVVDKYIVSLGLMVVSIMLLLNSAMHLPGYIYYAGFVLGLGLELFGLYTIRKNKKIK
jgi:hypothetical protein